MSTTTAGPRGIARRTDPATSHAAGAVAVARRGPTSRDRVKEILAEHGPLTHDQVIGKHQQKEVFDGWSPLSAERLRSATNELVRAGEVEAVPGVLGRSSRGNTAHLWRTVIVQSNETNGHDQ